MKDPLTPEELLKASWFEHDQSMKHLLHAIRHTAKHEKDRDACQLILDMTASIGDEAPEREFKINVGQGRRFL